MEYINKLEIKSPSFENNGNIPKKHTGFGKDISPEFYLLNLNEKVVSIAIIMDDLDIPMIKAYNHWIIWNIPKTDKIPENIPQGTIVPSLENAVQGIGYGINQYRGPKQPIFIRNIHRYIFCFYGLDCFLNLSEKSRKRDLVKAMQGHIVQYGNITGKYKR